MTVEIITGGDVTACESDWVLRLHPGEVPSDQLLAALGELTRDRRVSWFDVEIVGDGPPRFEPRLFRNIAGILGGIGEHRLAEGTIRSAGIPLPPPAPPVPYAYAGRVELLGTPPTVRAGVVHQQEVRIVNAGDDVWAAGDAPIRLGWRWRLAADQPVLRDGRDLLTATLRGGEELRQVLTVVTPDAPGDYLLEVELVHEHVRWFGTPATERLSVVLAREHRLLA